MNFETKTNYSPWKIKIQDFPNTQPLQEQIKFLLQFALLAPSGHNSQPWTFKLNSNKVEILIKQDRFLAQNDKQGRQSYISFGCLLENLLIAADYFGFQNKIINFPYPDCIAIVEFVKIRNITNQPEHLVNSITKRSTDRGEYLAKKPEINILSNLQKNPYNVTVSIADNETKNALGKTMVEAGIQVMDNNNFREELSNFIKSNTTNSSYGMPGFTLGIPMPISFIASTLIKKINLSKISKSKDFNLLKKSTPLILVLSTRDDTKESWVESGKALENLWLKITKLGLSCSALAAAVQVPNYREEIKKILKINTNPQIILRCGYSKNPITHSPRFLLSELISL